jgi:hypothetical protein
MTDQEIRDLAREIGFRTFPERRYHDDDEINDRLVAHFVKQRQALIEAIVEALTKTRQAGVTEGIRKMAEDMARQKEKERPVDPPTWPKPWIQPDDKHPPGWPKPWRSRDDDVYLCCRPNAGLPWAG